MTRALVLGGGGAVGNAWALGVVAGLAEAGVDVTDCDLVVGTSSGATAAAQLTSGSTPAELYTAIGAPSPPVETQAQRAPAASAQTFLEWSDAIIAASADAADMRRRLGAAALAADVSDGADSSRWREVVAARLPGIGWPARRVLITAVDALSGNPVVFDRDSGIDLLDAVAASTSNGYGPVPPYRIGDRRYVDGGYRRNENADLATGYDRVLVLSPFGGRSRMPAAWGMDLDTQLAELRTGGSRVEAVFPDDAAMFGANALDPALRPRAVRAGHAQGRALPAVATLWR